ncbi:hypothetical protein RB195_003009 [Necator americanus]|uniref:Uncharacterized protein n=1 Tax=Necator americanus TaxID=51031 RepID=A0ABR1DLN4_NECAM
MLGAIPSQRKNNTGSIRRRWFVTQAEQEQVECSAYRRITREQHQHPACPSEVVLRMFPFQSQTGKGLLGVKKVLYGG